MLDHALAYAAEGYEVFPVREADPKAKAPYNEHGMKEATTDAETIRRWWTKHPNALIGCRVPTDVVVLDIDPRHSGGRVWAELERQHGPAQPRRAHASGRNDGGRHLWFERPKVDALSARRLHDWAKANGVGQPAGKNGKRWTSGIDVLHHGWRYTILPPSLHPVTGKPYRWLTEGEPGPMPQWLARLVERPDATAPTSPTLAAAPIDDSIADWFSKNASWSDILKGWSLVEGDGETDGSKWRHPTATAANSASVRHGCLFVYSPNTDLEETEEGDPHGYTKFRAWAELEHDGDLSAAARAARERRDGPPPELHLKPTSGTPSSDTDLPGDDDADLRALLLDWGDFWSVDHNAEDWLIKPVIAAGRSHAMFAPGGTGKSLLSLWLAVQAATGGGGLAGVPGHPRNVLYLDYEMTPADLSERLESMGYGPDTDLSHLHYALLPSLPGLDQPEGGKAIVTLAQLVDAELVIIDTFGRAVHGDENEADTVRAWYRWTGLHLKHDGRAFLRVDHAGKDLEKGQRGTSAKNDDVDIVWQLAKADAGAFTLKARKRRMGWVPDEVKIEMGADPLSYRLLSGIVYPPGTVGLAAVLDALNVALDISARAAGEILRSEGRKATNAVIRAAVRYRQEEALRLSDDTHACGKPLETCGQPHENLWINAPESVRRGPGADEFGAQDGAGAKTLVDAPRRGSARSPSPTSARRRPIRAARQKDRPSEPVIPLEEIF